MPSDSFSGAYQALAVRQVAGRHNGEDGEDKDYFAGASLYVRCT